MINLHWFCVFIGLVEKPKEDFWTFIAEYPAHDKSIPPALENQFVHALTNGPWVPAALGSSTIF
jgi:hypothetical protein